MKEMGIDATVVDLTTRFSSGQRSVASHRQSDTTATDEARDRRSRAIRLRAQADLMPPLVASAYLRRAAELELEAHAIERKPA